MRKIEGKIRRRTKDQKLEPEKELRRSPIKLRLSQPSQYAGDDAVTAVGGEGEFAAEVRGG